MHRFEEYFKKKKKKSLGFGGLASQCTFSVYCYGYSWEGGGGWRRRRVVVGGQGEV